MLYVEQLIAPDVINTMPDATLRAFADHGDATRTLGGSTGAAEETLRRGAGRGLDLDAITAELEREGVQRLLRLLPRAARVHRRKARRTPPAPSLYHVVFARAASATERLSQQRNAGLSENNPPDTPPLAGGRSPLAGHARRSAAGSVRAT